MMKLEWGNRRSLPIDAKTTQSSISQVIGSREYIEWCAAAKKVQEYWRSPEYVIESNGVPILASNINAGDFFNHGQESTRIGIISKKITLVGKPSIEGLRESIHPLYAEYLRYECAGEMGGYFGELWHDHGFSSITSGYFVWLPLPVQLSLAGLDDEAHELNRLMASIVTKSKAQSE